MRFVDRLSLSTIAIVSGVIANIGGAGAFLLSGPMGTWIRANPVPLFWMTISINMVLFSVFGGYQRKLHAKKEMIEDLSRERANQERQYQSNIEERDERIETLKHQNRLDTQKERIANLERENQELKKLLNPSEHDRALFRQILNELPWQRGVLSYFNSQFDGKMWFGARVDPLYDFALTHEESYFDNEDMQATFQVLKEASSALVV